MPELNRELREIYLQPGELHIAPNRRSFGRLSRRASASRSGARSFEWARLLTRCCLIARRMCLVTGRRYVDFSIRHGGNLGR
ncbi:MAG TPA: hypothetical protein VJ255_01740 [Candidatus Acidoferrum sp.]|nr:hypothetical protein [Candidatus Acidoferrum sp.]